MWPKAYFRLSKLAQVHLAPIVATRPCLMKGHVQHITVCIYIYIIFSAFLQDEKALISSLHSKWVCHMLSIRTLCKPKFYGFGWNSSCMYCTVLCAEELDLGEKELWPTSLSAPVFLPSTKVPCRRRLPDLSDSHGMSWWSLMQRINMDRQHGGENVEFRLPSSLYEFLTVLDPLWDRQIEQSDWANYPRKTRTPQNSNNHWTTLIWP